MRVAIVNITGGGLSGGYRKYLEKLIPLLQADSRVSSLDVFVPAQSANLIRLADTPLHIWTAGRGFSGSADLKTRLRQMAPDVVFIPTAQWMDCGAIPVVTMVRNMEPLTDPFSVKRPHVVARSLARAYVAKRACRRAKRVIAVSRHVQDFLVERWRISSQKIGVVYHGLESPPARAETKRPAALHGKEIGSFVFTAGSIRPYRGLEDVIGALPVMHKHGIARTLVIGGAPDPETRFYKERLERLARKLNVASHIIWAGQLDQSEMSWCYYNCDAFVMTSRIEACPNVVLEAMSHGCVCVSTNLPPMPEFFGDSAFYYKVGDADDLARQLGKVLNFSKDEKLERQTAATGQAGRLNWSATADATISQLQLALH